MKKLCSFILAITTAATIFASGPLSVTTQNTDRAAFAQTAEIFDGETSQTTTYIGNKNTKKFHLPSCYTLPKEKNRVYIPSRKSAIHRNFKPCKNCNP